MCVFTYIFDIQVNQKEVIKDVYTSLFYHNVEKLIMLTEQPSRYTTLKQRRFNVLTFNRRCLNGVCLLGIVCRWNCMAIFGANKVSLHSYSVYSEVLFSWPFSITQCFGRTTFHECGLARVYLYLLFSLCNCLEKSSKWINILTTERSLFMGFKIRCHPLEMCSSAYCSRSDKRGIWRKEELYLFTCVLMLQSLCSRSLIRKISLIFIW